MSDSDQPVTAEESENTPARAGALIIKYAQAVVDKHPAKERESATAAKEKYLNHVDEYFGKSTDAVRNGKFYIHGYNRYLEEQAKSASGPQKKELLSAVQFGKKLNELVPAAEKGERGWGEAISENSGMVFGMLGALLGLLIGGGAVEGLLLAGIVGLVGMMAGPSIGKFMQGFIDPQPQSTPALEKSHEKSSDEKTAAVSVDRIPSLAEALMKQPSATYPSSGHGLNHVARSASSGRGSPVV